MWPGSLSQSRASVRLATSLSNSIVHAIHGYPASSPGRPFVIALSVARALVLLRVRGQMEREWGQGPSNPPEGEVQRAFSGHARY